MITMRTVTEPAHTADAAEPGIALPVIVAAADRPDLSVTTVAIMGYVAATAALFALGARAGRDLVGAVGIVAFIAAFACLIGMQFAVRRSLPLTSGPASGRWSGCSCSASC